MSNQRCNNPPSLFLFPISTMKIDKYVLYFDRANEKVSRRLGFVRLTPSELSIIMIIRRQVGARYVVIQSRLKDCGKPFSDMMVVTGLRRLVDKGLIEKRQGYFITSLGREYLSGVRNYLVNIRM